MRKYVIMLVMMMVMSSIAHGYEYSDYTWLTYNGHQYALTIDESRWEDAEAEAVAVGGHLVTINGEFEDAWLVATFVDPYRKPPWIGFYQDHNDPNYSEPAGGWKWISGEPVTYTNWGPGEPTNSPPSEDYGALYGDWGWNDTGPGRPGWETGTLGIIEISEPTMIYHVDGASGDNTNDGLTRETAFETIQRGINMAQDGDTVLVWPGVYNETATHGINFNGKAITVKSAADAAVLEVPGFVAVIFVQGEDANSVLSNFVVRGSLIGIFALFANPTINNVTVVDNDNGVIADNADPHITNSIFWNNTNGDLFRDPPLQAKYSCIEEGGKGQGNISIEPLFADANNGDYHLLSERGRYWPAHDVWVLDEVTSPCVDGGDPTVDPANEPMPNGGRINMGAYGNSAYASMSEWPLEHDSNRDGKVNMLDFAKMAQEWLETLPWAAPPQISITSPSEGALIPYNAIDPIYVEAEASGSVVKVEFFANGSKIGQDNNGLDGWDISWHPDSDGGFALTATATTQVGLQTTSTVVNVTVAYVW